MTRKQAKSPVVVAREAVQQADERLQRVRANRSERHAAGEYNPTEAQAEMASLEANIAWRRAVAAASSTDNDVAGIVSFLVSELDTARVALSVAPSAEPALTGYTPAALTAYCDALVAHAPAVDAARKGHAAALARLRAAFAGAYAAQERLRKERTAGGDVPPRTVVQSTWLQDMPLTAAGCAHWIAELAEDADATADTAASEYRLAELRAEYAERTRTNEHEDFLNDLTRPQRAMLTNYGADALPDDLPPGVADAFREERTRAY